MNKRNGFTLIELMIVVAIIGILIAIAVPALKGEGVVQEVQQSQCIEGVKFTVGHEPTQIIGPDGKGISCDTVSDDSYSDDTWVY